MLMLITATAGAQGADWLRIISDTLIYISEETSVVKITFQLDSGLYIQSNNPDIESVVPTEIIIKWPRGVSALDPIFPNTEELVPKGSDHKLQVFSGQLDVAVAINFNDQLIKGKYQIPAYVKYQACNNKRFFPPREQAFFLDLLFD